MKLSSWVQCSLLNFTILLFAVNHAVGLTFALVGRFFATAAMMVIILCCGEPFPTLLRNTAMSIACMVARVGTMSTPFIIFAGKYSKTAEDKSLNLWAAECKVHGETNF